MPTEPGAATVREEYEIQLSDRGGWLTMLGGLATPEFAREEAAIYRADYPTREVRIVHRTITEEVVI